MTNYGRGRLSVKGTGPSKRCPDPGFRLLLPDVHACQFTHEACLVHGRKCAQEPTTGENLFWRAQEWIGKCIESWLDAYQNIRDRFFRGAVPRRLRALYFIGKWVADPRKFLAPLGTLSCRDGSFSVMMVSNAAISWGIFRVSQPHFPPRYDYIDALRGYAILGVIAVHSGQSVANLPHTLKFVTEGSAKYGVQLFFVVSALALLLSWHKRSDGAARFYVRRLFRIAPMFWLAACVYLVIFGMAGSSSYWAHGGLTALGISATFLFLNGWSPDTMNALVPGG